MRHGSGQRVLARLSHPQEAAFQMPPQSQTVARRPGLCLKAGCQFADVMEKGESAETMKFEIDDWSAKRCRRAGCPDWLRQEGNKHRCDIG
jgi:hypothetical protein